MYNNVCTSKIIGNGKSFPDEIEWRIILIKMLTDLKNLNQKTDVQVKDKCKRNFFLETFYVYIDHFTNLIS